MSYPSAKVTPYPVAWSGSAAASARRANVRFGCPWQGEGNEVLGGRVVDELEAPAGVVQPTLGAQSVVDVGADLGPLGAAAPARVALGPTGGVLDVDPGERHAGRVGGEVGVPLDGDGARPRERAVDDVEAVDLGFGGGLQVDRGVLAVSSPGRDRRGREDLLSRHLGEQRVAVPRVDPGPVVGAEIGRAHV